MSEKLLFIHAGTHKTGSTSLQGLLRDKQAAFLQHGYKVIVDYPRQRHPTTNCASIAHAFVRPDLWTPTRINNVKPAQYKDMKVINWLTEEIKTSPCKKFILSAEAFCYMRTQSEREFLIEFLKNCQCDMLPIIYFRNKIDWKESWSDQVNNKEPKVKKFMVEHPEYFQLLNDWYFDHRAIYDFWHSLNPKAIFFDYDKIVGCIGNVIPPFLRALGLPESMGTGQYRLNRRSASKNTLE